MRTDFNEQGLPKVLLAHPGTQYSHDTARQLNRLGLLYKYCTGFAFATDSITYSLSKVIPGLQKRLIKGIPSSAISTYSLLEFEALYKIRKGGYYETVFYERNEKFQQAIPHRLLKNADVVIGYDTSSWILAKRCKELGKRFILDVSIGHPVSKERIYRDIAADYPEWGGQVMPKPPVYLQYEQEEMALADTIVVPSHFVRDTYVENGISEDKIRVNPFGTDIRFFVPPQTIKKHKDKPLTFLFFGSLHARKGLPVLFQAWKELAPSGARLLLAGYEQIPATVTVPSGVEILGAIAKDKRVELYHNADVFVFPSYFEGFAQVQIEAAACGLPLIGTYNSGAHEIVRNGESGFIVETGNKAALKKALLYCLTHHDQLIEMGIASRRMAEQFSWDAYGERWKSIILDSKAG